MSILDRVSRVVDADYLSQHGWPIPNIATERSVARLLAGWNVEVPELQHHVGRYRLDFAWPAYNVALEIDGWHHDRPDQMQHGWERHRWLTRHGWIVLHIDPDADNWQDLLVNVARFLDVANAPWPRRDAQ